MAGIAKPNIPDLGKEMTINFLNSQTNYTPNFKTELFDGDLSAGNGVNSALFLYTSYTGCFVEFEVTEKCRIWGYTLDYSDSGGNLLNPCALYKKDENTNQYVFVKNSNTPVANQWYSLFDELEVGTYKIQSSDNTNYCGWSEWYIEQLEKENINPLTIKKTLKDNLPTSIDSSRDELHFTEDGGIYLSKNDGTLRQVGIDDETIEKIADIEDKINDLSQNGGNGGSGMDWDNLSYIHKGNDEPTDKSKFKLWIDTSDSTKILIKTYDEIKSAWITLNDIPTQFIKNITYKNGELTITREDNTETKISITGTSGANIKKSNINGNILVNEEEIKVYDDTNVMKSSKYASIENDGCVKLADEAIKIKDVNLQHSLMYYGTDKDGNIGAHFLPMTAENLESGMYQTTLLNATVDVPQYLPTMCDLSDCKLIVQGYRFVAGEQNIVNAIKHFNNGNKDSFYYNEYMVKFGEDMSIKNNYVYTSTKVGDLYESEEIDKTQFLGEMVVNLNG